MPKLSHLLFIIVSVFMFSCGGSSHDHERAEREADSLFHEALREIEADFETDTLQDTLIHVDTIIISD